MNHSFSFICFSPSHKIKNTSYGTPPGFNEKNLSLAMFSICNKSSYAPSLTQLDVFCASVFAPSTNLYCYSACVLCHIEGLLVGFLNANITFENVDIDFIAIQEEYKRKKIAETLFEIMEKELILKNKIKLVTLEVGVQNQAALHFYEKIGFKKIGIRTKYYKNREDAVIMQKIYQNRE